MLTTLLWHLLPECGTFLEPLRKSFQIMPTISIPESLKICVLSELFTLMIIEVGTHIFPNFVSCSTRSRTTVSEFLPLKILKVLFDCATMAGSD
ncbi:hypothetical protein PR048_020979 [Dryococelus australis]|uniref:Uncharacterized protein n=1 Tax=Dryococelus australis TaxID=614101 RepID=A0ABQ9GWZ5_9NEOP|nr:hypothetical protein PR048_020979 [Dryococelus australis]